MTEIIYPDTITSPVWDYEIYEFSESGIYGWYGFMIYPMESRA